MSNLNNNHGLADLGLGAPIGGGSTTSHSTNTYNTSSTSAGAPVSGLTSGHHHDSSHVHDANCGHSSSGVLGSGSRSNDYDASHVHDANCGHNLSTLGSGSRSNDYDASHVHDDKCGHDSSYGASGQSRNTTSGDQGIGRGHGGTTAFESDASKVGEGSTEHRSMTDRLTGREHGQHGVSGSGAATAAGLTGAGHDLTHQHHTSGQGVGSDLRDREAGIKAGLGAGHHDQSSSSHGLTSGSGLNSGSGLTGSHEHHQHGATSGLTSGQGLTSGSHEHHHHSGATAAGMAGVGAAGVGLTGREATRMDQGGVIADSVTGQTHFVESGLSGQSSTTGLGHSSTSGVGHSTSGVGHSSSGLGAGAVGAGLASQGQQGQGLSSKLHGQGERSEGGPLSELKQELKEHQSGNAGHAVDHPESKGPHGLVWHNGKYVHERELSGHGSTGVPLR